MKKLFAATLAAILILSAAGCAKKPVQQEEPAAPVQEEAIVPEAPAEAEKSQDNVIHITRKKHDRLSCQFHAGSVYEPVSVWLLQPSDQTMCL